MNFKVKYDINVLHNYKWILKVKYDINVLHNNNWILKVKYDINVLHNYKWILKVKYDRNVSHNNKWIVKVKYDIHVLHSYKWILKVKYDINVLHNNKWIIKVKYDIKVLPNYKWILKVKYDINVLHNNNWIKYELFQPPMFTTAWVHVNKYLIGTHLQTLMIENSIVSSPKVIFATSARFSTIESSILLRVCSWTISVEHLYSSCFCFFISSSKNSNMFMYCFNSSITDGMSTICRWSNISM